MHEGRKFSLPEKKLELILLIFFSIFFLGFILAPDTKAHRILFFSAAVFPFLIFRFRHIYECNQHQTIFLSTSYLGLLALSIFWSNVDNARIDKEILEIISTYFFICISFYYFSQKSWQRIFDLFLAVSFFVAIISIFQFYQEHEFPKERLMNTVHSLHPSITANYFLLAIILTATKIKKIYISRQNFLYIFLIIFFTFCILLTHSRGAMLGFLVSGVFIFSVKNKKYAVIFIALCSIGALIYWLIEPNLFEKLFKRGLSYRPEIFSTLIERVGDNIFLGLGALASEAVPFNDFTAVHSHSIYMASFYHLGLVGLTFHGLILALTLWQGINLYYANGNMLPVAWMIMGASCLSIDGSLISRPYLMEWLLFWAPVTLTAARYSQLKLKEAR